MVDQISSHLEWDLMNPILAQNFNQLVVNPMTNVRVLSNLSLVIGVNYINHGLGVQQSGWFLTDIQGVADIYRSAPFNDLTLVLTSSAKVNVCLGVF